MALARFDRINQLTDIEWKRKSMEYAKYFGEMGISDEQIKERIELSEKLEDIFDSFFELFFTVVSYGIIPYDSMMSDLARDLNLAFVMAGITVPMTAYAQTLAEEIFNVTNDHADEPYYTSVDRAMFISENTANKVWEDQDFQEALEDGMTMKTWCTMQDRRVRETHREVDGMTIPISEPFGVGGSFLMYPRDTSMGASDDEIVNCRCWVEYS